MLRVRGESGAGRGRGKHTTHPRKRHTSYASARVDAIALLVFPPVLSAVVFPCFFISKIDRLSVASGEGQRAAGQDGDPG